MHDSIRGALALCAAALVAPAAAHADPAWVLPSQRLATVGFESDYSIGFDSRGVGTEAVTDLITTSRFGDQLRVVRRRAGEVDAPELTLSDPGVARENARIAVSPTGFAVLAWEEEDTAHPGDLRYLAAFRRDGEWGPPAVLATVPAGLVADPIPVVDADGDGDVVIGASLDELPDTGLPGGEVLLARHGALGWAAAQRISGGSSDQASAAYDGGDDLTIVWRTEVEGVSADGPARHAVVARELAGGVLGPETTLSFPTDDGDAGAPKLGVGPGGDAVVAYSFQGDRTAASRRFVAAQRPGAGAPWRTQQQLSDQPGTALGAAVAADGTAYVLYSQAGGTAAATRVFLQRGPARQPFTVAKAVSPAGVTAATGGVAMAGNQAAAVWANQDGLGTYTVSTASWAPGAAEPVLHENAEPPSAAWKIVTGVTGFGTGSAVATWTVQNTVTDPFHTALVAFDGDGPEATDVVIPARADAGQALHFNVRMADLWSFPWTTPRWDFGDGTTVEGEQPAHTYAAPGRYRVSVVSRDALGNPTAVTGDVVVTGAQAGAGGGDPAPAVVTVPRPAPPAAPTAPPPARDPAPAAPSRVAIDLPACPKAASKAACDRRRHSAAAWRTLRGTVAGATRVTVRARHGRRTVAVTARVSGSRWTASLRGLSAGRWTITVHAGTAIATRTVKLD